MTHPSSDFHILADVDHIGQPDERECAHLESLIRADYERCHPGGTLETLQRRARFSKEDRGLLRDWMAVAVRRAKAKGARRRLSTR
ncbi:hypothetical protein [Mesorhizobium sp.]|uniref:hypothetical protein n=1 Tax=Mesorhizobium sp. TaxID=1871066 RepID=UPI0025D7E7EB|nr:hypothetical protein [Mesorhizobium sp.]